MEVDATKNQVAPQRVLRNVISNYAGKLISLLVGFLLTPFILNELGASTYGLWALVGSVVAYIALLDFGITGAVIKYVAEHRARGENEQAQRLTATALWLYSGLGLLAVLISTGIAMLFPAIFNVPPDQQATATWLVVVMGVALGISIPCTTTTATTSQVAVAC